MFTFSAVPNAGRSKQCREIPKANDLLVYNEDVFDRFKNLQKIENVVFTYGELIYVRD